MNGKKYKPIVKRSGTNICIECANACGGCSWTEVDEETGRVKFVPVPGWTATAVSYFGARNRGLTTYHITACPLFRQG